MPFVVSRAARFLRPYWTFPKRSRCGKDNRMSHKKKKQNVDAIPDKKYRGHRARSALSTHIDLADASLLDGRRTAAGESVA